VIKEGGGRSGVKPIVRNAPVHYLLPIMGNSFPFLNIERNIVVQYYDREGSSRNVQNS